MSWYRDIDSTLYQLVRRLSPALEQLAQVERRLELVERHVAHQLGRPHTGRPGRLRHQVLQAHATVLCAHIELLNLAGYPTGHGDHDAA